MGDAENPQGSLSRSVGLRSRTIAFTSLNGSVASRIRRSARCLHSKGRGRSFAQSNAINRYVGKLTDLYPSDPWQAALCDETMEAVEDISSMIVATLFLPEDEKKAQRKVLVEGPLPFYLTRLQQRLEECGGQYFAGERLSVADLKVSVWIRHLKSGALDHVPTDLVEQAWS
jgi:glutathione S-transferase